MKRPITIFYVYAETDEVLRQQLNTHLALLRRQEMIVEWQPIQAGAPWAEKTERAFDEAKLILLLVSADFLNSDVCYEQQMQRALERERNGEVRVVPILLRPVDLTNAPFTDLPMMPTNGKPVTLWSNQDEAWAHITEGIRCVLEGKPLPNVQGRKREVGHQANNQQVVYAQVIGESNPPTSPSSTPIALPVNQVGMMPNTQQTHALAQQESVSLTEFHSCFISYSSQDQEFVEQLYADLRSKGVRCWIAQHDMKIGNKIRSSIDESIRAHDKLLLILSERSVVSQWVETEVETAFEQERLQNKLILFPIRIDKAVMRTTESWAADIRRTRHIGDFQKWKNHSAYQEALTRLLHDLRVQPLSAESASSPHPPVSRRLILRSLAGVATAGGLAGLTWFALSQHSPESPSTRNNTAVTPTQIAPSIPLGTIVTTYRGHDAPVLKAAWSPDSRRVASASQDSTVQIWWAALGSHMFTYSGHISPNAPIDVAWSPDSIYLASRASAQEINPVNANVQVWNTTSKKSVFTSVDPRCDGGKIAWSPKGGQIAVGNYDPSPQTIVRILDATTGISTLTYNGHSLGVNGLAWSPDGIYVASGSYDATVQIWNARNGNLFYRMNHADSVFAVAWSPNGAFIASGGGGDNPIGDYTVRVWKAV